MMSNESESNLDAESEISPDLPVRYVENFLPDHQQFFDYLLKFIQWDERMNARKTASLGVPYNYSGIEYEQRPFPSEFDVLLSLLQKSCGFLPNNCLLNLYSDGKARMGYHQDAIEHLSPSSGIAIISVGSPRTLTFRNINHHEQRQAFCLSPGSLFYMSLEMQNDWAHGIKPESTAGPRISLTFREIVM